MQLPAIIIKGEGVFQTVYNPTAFHYGTGDEAILHPAAAWSLWNAADWADMCPDWTVLPLVDFPPAETGKKAVQRPMAEWLIETDAVKVTYKLVDLAPGEIEAQATTLAAARAAAVATNNAAAGRAREAYLTAVPGQATTYAAKQAETASWIEAGRPSDASAAAYPWAGDRADLRSVTVADVLAEWVAVTAAWEAVGRQIERERERVNDAVNEAGTLEAIQAARDSAAYPGP